MANLPLSIVLERDSSVNQLVRDSLHQLTATDSRKQEAKHRLLSTSFGYEPIPFNRESLYER